MDTNHFHVGNVINLFQLYLINESDKLKLIISHECTYFELGQSMFFSWKSCPQFN